MVAGLDRQRCGELGAPRGRRPIGKVCGTTTRISAIGRTPRIVQRAQPGLGSLGKPSTRSPTMLRWIWLVPPQIVSEREKKNDDIIGLTG